MLRRWAALNDGPMPANWAEFANANTTAALEIQQRDPELVSLLSGEAPAALRLQALTGELADAAPTVEQQAAAATEQQIAAILEATGGNPYGQASHYNDAGELVGGRSMDLTAALQLEALNPELAAQLKLMAAPAAAPTGMNAEQTAFVNAELTRARMESLQAANTTGAI